MLSNIYLSVKSIKIEISYVNTRRCALYFWQGEQMGYSVCLLSTEHLGTNLGKFESK